MPVNLALAFSSLAILVPSSLEDARKLETGRVLVEMDRTPGLVHRFACSGLIDAPLSRVWQVMIDFGHYDRMYTGIKRSEVRRVDGNVVYGYFLLDFPWPLPKRWTLNETRLEPTLHRFEWRRVDGDVRRYEGFLQLYTWSRNRTRLEYRGLMDPGYSFVPGWLLDFSTEQVLPAVVEGVRARIAAQSDH